MLNSANTTSLVGLVNICQTELYQDSTDYNELEKSRLLMNFFVTINPVTSKLLHYLGHIVTQFLLDAGPTLLMYKIVD